MFKFIKNIFISIRTFGYIEVSQASEELEEVTGAYEYYRNFSKSGDTLCKKGKVWIEDYFTTFTKDFGLEIYGISFNKIVKYHPSIKFISEIRYVKKSKFKEYITEQIVRNNEFREVRDRFQKTKRDLSLKGNETYHDLFILSEIEKEMFIKDSKINSFIFKMENGINDIKYFIE